MAELAPVLKHRFYDTNGDPLAGGKLYTYLAGTSTPQATYTDETEATPNTNPIILDADGECNLWLDNAYYKLVLYDADDVEQWSVDRVAPPSAVEEDEDSAWTEYAVTDGQSATTMSGQTVDFATYSSALYEVEIVRGTTVVANGRLAIQNVNGTGRLVPGTFMTNEAHGLTFSISQASLVATLRVAASTGPGNGTVKLSRRLIPA